MSVPGRGNTSKKPDGKPQGQLVSFTRGAADRIAKVVRKVERGDTGATGLTFGRPMADGIGKDLKLATFTGDWQTAQYKTVTLYNQTTTPNTASVYNWCNPSIGFSTSNTTEERFVIFGAVRGTNSVVEIQQAGTSSQSTCTLTLGSVDLTQILGYVPEEVQLLGHSVGDTAATCAGVLQWFSVTTCATATASP